MSPDARVETNPNSCYSLELESMLAPTALIDDAEKPRLQLDDANPTLNYQH